MHTANANGVPVITFTQPAGLSSGAHHFASIRKDFVKQLMILGALQMVFGILCLVFQATTIAVVILFHLQSFTFIGYVAWSGIFFIITGAIGISGAKRNNKGLVIAFNVLLIISASMTVVLFIQTVSSAYVFSVNYDRYLGFNGNSKKGTDAGVAMESMLAILAIAEAIVAIWSSVVCCKIGACCCDCGDACCCPPSLVPTQVFTTEQHTANQQQPIVTYTVTTERIDH